MFTHQQIIDYFNSTERDYNFYLGRNSLCLGYWDETTSNVFQSIRRMYSVMIDRAGIKKSDLVLDAGCGQGKSAAHIAKEIGCRVHGITLIPRQVELARQLAQKEKVDHLVAFNVMDYHHIDYPDEYFDVVWGLESICHSLKKKDFVKEAFRVLKKGGRLIVSDMFKTRKDMTPEETKLFHRTFYGYLVWDLDTIEDFASHMTEAGFRNISTTNIMPHIMPTINYLSWISMPWLFYIPLRNRLGENYRYRINNLWASFTLKKISDLKLIAHQIIVGTK